MTRISGTRSRTCERVCPRAGVSSTSPYRRIQSVSLTPMSRSSAPHPTYFGLRVAGRADGGRRLHGHGTMMLDGSGNDKYMHYSPTRRERLLRAISLPSRLGGLGLGRRLVAPIWVNGVPMLPRAPGMYANERWFPGTKLSAELIRPVDGLGKGGAFVRTLTGSHASRPPHRRCGDGRQGAVLRL